MTTRRERSSFIDIISQYGAGVQFRPHPCGHAVHLVAEQVITDPETTVEFVVDADDICEPCIHLVDGRCDDVLSQLDPPGDRKRSHSKQDYNDDLDRRLLAFLGMDEGQAMPFREYLHIIREHLEGIEAVCTHPGEDPSRRRANLMRGLAKLEA